MKAASHLDQQAILEAIRHGEDHRAVEQLYQHVFPQVRTYVMRNNGDADDAFDMFQDALLKCFRQVIKGAFRQDQDIGGYLYTIARNRWINHAKRSQRMSAWTENTPEPSQEPEGLEAVAQQDRAKAMDQLLSGLGERCKDLLLLSIFEKLSMAEIKEKLGFASENAAKTKNYKCKQRLIALAQERPELVDILKS